MLFKNKNSSNINEDQLALIEYAQARIKSKKKLFYHFSFFIIGSIISLIADLVFDYKSELTFLEYSWSYWVCSLWLLLLLFHLFNVYVKNKFIGKKWEKEQLKKLVEKQQIKISEIKAELEKEARIIAESELYSQKNPKSLVTLIAAASENNVIGKDNKLIWHLSDDLKHFKNLTKDHHVIMGRKTFESMPKALPNRTNIVITRNKDYVGENITVVQSLEEALNIAKDDSQPFIIGGGEIYNLAIEIADRIELTRVHAEFNGDAFFPTIDSNKWTEVKRDARKKDEKHSYDFTFIRYDKKQ